MLEPLLAPGAVERKILEVHGGSFVNYSYRGEWGSVYGLSADLLLEAFLHVRGEPSDRAAVRLDELLRFLASQSEQT